MGLDQYLYRRHYVKNWDHRSDHRWGIEITFNNRAVPSDQLNRDKIVHIDEEVAYWRKANQIHAWFVENCQDGNDDCGYHYVSLEQLQELLDKVREVLEDHSKAADVLPSRSGFFFGSTEYDEMYFEDLLGTEKMLIPLLSGEQSPGFDGFIYHSSW